MNYYQFHIGDYMAHTAHLDEIEDIAYRRMLDYCYLNECGLPESVDDIARVIRMRTHCERIANVLLEFFVKHEDGTYRSKRVDEELTAFAEKSEKARDSARKRWKNTDANAMRTQCERNANQEPITNNHKPITKGESMPAVAGRPPAGTRLPDDWIPDVLFAVSEGFTEFDARTEGEKFRDYWRSQPGARGRKADWQATWRNWIRRAGEDKRKPTTHPGSGSFVQRHTSADWRVGL